MLLPWHKLLSHLFRSFDFCDLALARSFQEAITLTQHHAADHYQRWSVEKHRGKLNLLKVFRFVETAFVCKELRNLWDYPDRSHWLKSTVIIVHQRNDQSWPTVDSSVSLMIYDENRSCSGRWSSNSEKFKAQVCSQKFIWSQLFKRWITLSTG